ncbi:alpha-galactosidase [Aquipuribacter nitratireducens]|uniref:alpha-galactosidase n=1 Tax=Aquipuribacter nitratireducens TaxID=650104 RepID=A0ABW0GN28_9MICO
MTDTTTAVHQLRGGGVALVLAERADGLPEIVHWGADLGLDTADADACAALLAAGVAPVPHSTFDAPWPLTLLPGEADGWSGRPGLAAHRGGRAVLPRWSDVRVDSSDDRSLVVEARDPAAEVALRSECVLDEHGVLAVRHTVTSTAGGEEPPLDVAGVLAVVPLPPSATELLDLTGRWCRERHPQRLPLRHGGRVRESRRGRTGHDATLLLVAGTAGFGFADGEVDAVHVAWSGDHVHLVERLPEGAGRHAGVLAGGELLRPGEVRLGAGESYASPPVLFVHDDAGLDGVGDRLHRHVRARPEHPRSPRPVTLNSWEAVYFDHDHDRLAALVDTAARVGVERVVLDDGWFLGRRDDSRGLGDWVVDPAVWPADLGPFADRVRSHGMQVGLWVEPEMVNPDSDVARAHPDWVLGPAPASHGSAPGTRPWRRQQALDLTQPGAYAHVRDQLDRVLSDVRPDYLKWDHNRDLHEAVDAQGRPAVHRQTQAAYRLMTELQERHPGLEIESCASGGARVDLGVLARTQRVWTSDCNDALERQTIQRWTSLLLPPELMGTHVGPEHSHTTGRSLGLSLRCLSALFGHAGIEWDISRCDEAELARVAGWVALHKRLRPLLHTGRTVRGEEHDGAWWHGVVAPDRTHAVLAYVRLTTGADAVPGLLRLPGLDPGRRYAVRALDPTGLERPQLPRAVVQPPWIADGVELSGRVLARHGLAMPVVDPADGLLVELTAVG